MSQSRRAFTLIELLVVVAIMAILMAVLLPSLSRARDTAKKSACASNLRMLGVAMNTYAQTNSDRYPPSQWFWGTPDGSNNYTWTRFAREEFGMVYKEGNDLRSKGAAQRVFLCPGADQHPSTSYANSKSQYTANPRLLVYYPVNDPRRPSTRYPFYKSTRVQRPYEMVLLADGPLYKDADHTYQADYAAITVHQNRLFWSGQFYMGGGLVYQDTTSPNRNDNGWSVNQGDGPSVGNGASLDYGPASWGGRIGLLRYRHDQNRVSNFVFADGHVAGMTLGATRASMFWVED